MRTTQPTILAPKFSKWTKKRLQQGRYNYRSGVPNKAVRDRRLGNVEIVNKSTGPPSDVIWGQD
jgi:hypothetical protein